MTSYKVGDYHFDSVKNCYVCWDGKDWIEMTSPGAISSPYNPSGAHHYYSDNTINIGTPMTPQDVFQVQTKYGDIRANLSTGELTVPAGVSRDTALRDFWMGFLDLHLDRQNNNDKVKELQRKLKETQENAENYAKYADKEFRNKMIEKIRTKYGNEKFIMTKPDDLIRLLETE